MGSAQFSMTCLARALSMPWRHADGAKRIANSHAHSVGHNKSRQPSSSNTSGAYSRALTPDLSGSAWTPLAVGSLARCLQGRGAELIGGAEANRLQLGESLGQTPDCAELSEPDADRNGGC